MDFPMPPKPNREMNAHEAGPQPVIETPPVADVPPDLKLSDDETEFIFKTTLRDDQRNDPRILKFILSYCECRNAAQAARVAGLDGRGAHLRGRPEIHACIEAITAKAVMKYGLDASEIVERVKEIAGIDPIEFENPDGSYKTHLSQIAPEARRAIKKFKVKNLYGKDANDVPIVIGQLVEVELWDKMKGLELIGREKSLFKETKKVEHDLTQNMANVLLASSRRADQRVLPAPEMRDVNIIDVSDAAKAAHHLMKDPNEKG